MNKDVSLDVNISNNDSKSLDNLWTLVWQYLKDNKWIFAVYSILLIAIPMEQNVFPYIYGIVLDKLSTNPTSILSIKNSYYFVAMIVAYMSVQLLYCVVDYYDGYIMPNLQSYIRKNIVSNIVDSYKENFNELETGEIISRLSSITTTYRELIHQFRHYFMPTIILIISSLIFFFYNSKKLGIATIILFIVCTILVLNTANRCETINAEHDKYSNYVYEYINDFLSNILQIYSTPSHKKELNKLQEKENTCTNKYTSSIHCSVKLKLLYSLIITAVFVTIVGYSMFLAYKKEIPYIAVGPILIVTLYLVDTLQNSCTEIKEILNEISNIDETTKYLKNLAAMKKNPIQTPIEIKKGDIKFENVNLDPILKDINLHIKSGEKVAVIGHMGSGKSTLGKLLLKFKDCTGGQILIDNIDITKVNSDQLREQIGYIPQEPKLLNTTIYENLTYGISDKYTVNDMNRLISLFKLDKMFNDPDFLQISVGKNASRLSGGQKQTIFIIRCLLQNKKVLIMDEPTSALDPKNRDMILRTIMDEMKGSTIIIITHNMDNLKYVDRVIDMHKGTIVSDSVKDLFY